MSCESANRLIYKVSWHKKRNSLERFEMVMRKLREALQRVPQAGVYLIFLESVLVGEIIISCSSSL